MAKLLPVVRQLTICEDFWWLDPQNPNKISLINLINAIRSLEDPPFPVLQEGFCAFLVLSNGRGSGKLKFRVVRSDTEEVILTTAERVVSFGANPLRVVGVPARIRNCEFPVAGLYWVQAWFNGQLLAEAELLLK